MAIGSASPLAAAGAYRAAQTAPGVGLSSPAPPSGFGEALGRALESAVETNQQAEVTAAQGLAGGGNTTDIVLAVSRAEMALQTTVAVRDRVIAAYQDVMRMPI